MFRKIARGVIRRSAIPRVSICLKRTAVGIFSAIHEQSADINQGVDKKKKEEQGAGDQGMMFWLCIQ